MHQFIIHGDLLELAHFPSNWRVSEFRGFFTFILGVFLEEEAELENYLENILRHWVVVAQEPLHCLVVFENWVVLELVLQLVPTYAQNVFGRWGVEIDEIFYSTQILLQFDEVFGQIQMIDHLLQNVETAVLFL